MEKTYYTYANGCRCEELFNFAQDSTDWVLDPQSFLSRGLGNQFSDSQLEDGVKDKIKRHSWDTFDFYMEKVFRVTDGNYVYEARTNPKAVHGMISSEGQYDCDHIYERLIEDAVANMCIYEVEETLTQTEFEIQRRDEALSLDFKNLDNTSANIRNVDFHYLPTFVESATHINRVDSFSMIFSGKVFVGFYPFASVPIEISASGVGNNTRQWSKPCVTVHYEDACFNGGFPLRESEYPEAFALLKSKIETKLTQDNLLTTYFKDRRDYFLERLPNQCSLPKPTNEYEYIDKDGVKHSEALPCVPCDNPSEVSQWLKCVALTRLPSIDEYEKVAQTRLDPSKNNAVYQLIADSLRQIAVTDGKTVFCADAQPNFASDQHAGNVCNLWIHHKENYAVVRTKPLSQNNTRTIESLRVKSR